MRICLLTNQDLDADPFPADDWPCDPRPFLPEHEWEVATLSSKQAAPAEVEALLDRDFDLYFNLCDGAADQDIPGIEVVLTLERAGVPFTGASSGFYEPSREQMKAACRRAGIAAPAGRVVSSLEEAERVAAELRYPLFVKHPSSYSSVDLTRHSRVCSPAGLRRQAAKMIRRHGAALIEEFVAGIECTVLVAENPDDSETPITYTPIAYRFPPGESFKHARLKWEDYAGLEAAPVADPVLAARLRRESAAFFRAIGGAGFGRCDIRVDPEGTPWFLEINPNCGVFYPPTDPGSADLCLAHDPAGHAGFARTLVQAALARHARRSGGRPGKDAQPPEPPSSWRTTIGT